MRLPPWLLSRIRAATNRIEIYRKPDLVIGDPPYMARWYVIPRNRLFNIYYHRIMRSDDDRALHDHPYPFNISILLSGCYLELTPADRRNPAGPTKARVYWAGHVLARWGAYAHRLELQDGMQCRTLFITGPRVREWGFYCKAGWRHWKDFTSYSTTGDSRTVGPGCGED